MDEYLEHIGIARRSGRYPWGSGDSPFQSSTSFLGRTVELRREGMSDTEIAKALGLTSTELRAYKIVANNEKRAADAARAYQLREKNYSPSAIAKSMGINESSVRNLLANPTLQKSEDVTRVANALKKEVGDKGVIDIGLGTEHYFNLSKERMNASIAILEAEGYQVHNVKLPQVGTGELTNYKVLAPPGVEWRDVVKNPGDIKVPMVKTNDAGQLEPIKPPTFVDPKRVGVRYASEGGADKDGVIELRRGVKDLDMGGNKYAQVRIAVGEGHYLKGMAMYSDDIPKGVDMVFNTNKDSTGNKLDAMKKVNRTPDGGVDFENPFGSSIKDQRGALNIVNEEGDWDKWSKSLSSQMLSKQSPALAKQQLGMGADIRKAEFDEIMALSNPAVKRKLLMSFADNADSAAVNLKAAALPRQANKVILPIPSLKDTEIYAPTFKQGESVVLIRHPHGGTFEIPELRVNNRNADAKRLLGNAFDAVGINPKVAERLSGADFDGDTVLVIPNAPSGIGRVKTSPALSQLKDFDAKKAYPAYEGMPKLTNDRKQRLMGDVSNLITDMSIKNASQAEIARAVKHSMVVIDAEKHNLNHKLSYIKNGIAGLKVKYQGRKDAGASTLVSLASSEIRVHDRKARPAAEGGAIDKNTGEKMYVPTGKSYIRRTVNQRTGVVTEKEIPRMIKSTRMAEEKDAFNLASGTTMEAVYASHANRLKALANEARREAVNTKNTPYSPAAAAAYSKEVASLSFKLKRAQMNAPLERQAQVVANQIIAAKKRDNPQMDDDDLKKVRNRALKEARLRTGADKTLVKFEPREWEAVQAGAITNNRLEDLLKNADLDNVKSLATPRTTVGMPTAKAVRARSMLNAGYTQSEVAEALGVSVSTLNRSLD